MSENAVPPPAGQPPGPPAQALPATTQVLPPGPSEPAVVDGAPAAHSGLVLGPWVLQQHIGQGGMGEVWQARRGDGLYEAQVAIKLLRSDLALVPLALRFARERAALARLNHPAIARLLDAGITDGRAYIVLELVDGLTLGEHVRRHVPGLVDRVRLLLGIAQAVDHAHAQLIVHRDLKPNNVMVTPAGAPKLLDFGLAGLLDDSDAVAGESGLTRQTGRGLTLGYAAPEQITGAATGTAADVFALGVILFELMSGAMPFGRRHDGRAAAERAVLHDEPRRLSEVRGPDLDDGPGAPTDVARARGDLEAITAKALRKDPAQRYGSARALIDDLQRWLAHEPVSVRRDDWRHRSRLWLRRHTVLAASGALVLGALAAGLAATTWQWRRAEQALHTSDAVTRFLTQLLASANPEKHGGQVPSVLQLLDSSRQMLAEPQAQPPETRLRLLEVLTRSYLVMNRFEPARPLAEQWVALARQQHGEHAPPTLLAKLSLGQVLQVMHRHADSVALLEPLGPGLVAAFGADSEPVRQQLFVLAADYMHTARLADAETALQRVQALTERLHPGDDFERIDLLNNLAVLRRKQGRQAEALQVLRSTQPLWTKDDPRLALQVLVVRHNELDMMLDIAEYTGFEARSRALGADMRRVLGPGNDLQVLQQRALGSHFLHTGAPDKAAAVHAALLAQAQADQLAPAELLRPRAEVLLTQARAGLGEAATLRQQGQALLAEMAASTGFGGGDKVRGTLALADLGLVLNDLPLARQALQAAPAEAGQRQAAQLARAEGDLPTSRRLLAARIARLQNPADLPRVLLWSAWLNQTVTLALMGDGEAGAALAAAQAARPASVPPGHVLDEVAQRLQARLAGPAPAAAASPLELALWRRAFF